MRLTITENTIRYCTVFHPRSLKIAPINLICGTVQHIAVEFTESRHSTATRKQGRCSGKKHHYLFGATGYGPQDSHRGIEALVAREQSLLEPLRERNSQNASYPRGQPGARTAVSFSSSGLYKIGT